LKTLCFLSVVFYYKLDKLGKMSIIIIKGKTKGRAKGAGKTGLTGKDGAA